MDHHCPWINKCVGQDNQGMFILSCLGFIVAILWHVIMAFLYCVNIVEKQHESVLAGIDAGVTSGTTENNVASEAASLNYDSNDRESERSSSGNASTDATPTVEASKVVDRPPHPLRWSGDDADFFGSLWRLCLASPWTAWLFAVSLTFVGFISFLFFCQIKCVFTNLTWNETTNLRRYAHFRDSVSGKFRNPFDRGSWRRNWVDRISMKGISKARNWKQIYSLDELTEPSKKLD